MLDTTRWLEVSVCAFGVLTLAFIAEPQVLHAKSVGPDGRVAQAASLAGLGRVLPNGIFAVSATNKRGLIRFAQHHSPHHPTGPGRKFTVYKSHKTMISPCGKPNCGQRLKSPAIPHKPVLSVGGIPPSPIQSAAHSQHH